MRKKVDERKKNPLEFWSHVQKQFDYPDFVNVTRVHDAMQFDQSLVNSLFPFLTQQICITDNLDIKTRFDLLSENAQFNFISLISISQNLLTEVPKELLVDPFIRSIYEAYSEKPPKITISIPIEESHSEEQPPPEIQAERLTAEFYDELDTILMNYPKYAESVLAENLPVNSFQLFYNSITGFYLQQRSLEGSTFVMRFVVRPYIEKMTSSANRLVSDALLSVSPLISEIIIDEMMKPIVFNPNSLVYQFEFLQRLFRDKNICQKALSRLFQSRPPSLEPKLKKEALNLICTAIQKSPQLTEEGQRHILLHIRNQIEHWQNDDTAKLLIFFFKQQEITDQQSRQIATDSISLIPERMRQIAMQMLNRKS
ncbi:hypothetical protein TRFO_43200 [Tritrichomonas foetus]|uniref:Uncharacterized protein n=1 Tax=Tritrichomonas foetus TaxID=1144522 RepID=A0A1J4KS70_9EUKA|nr:hypothetical protein TRFO_43200 [Tritrichomonas foetus]|eukprot:OHT13946.1 hypothetical protein TRFO_43200 [Tritrichomonas foetus]